MPARGTESSLFNNATLIRAIAANNGLRPMFKQNPGLFAPNKYGAISYQPRSNNSDLMRASTQVFRNGEMWGFAPWLLVNNDIGRIVPTGALEANTG